MSESPIEHVIAKKCTDGARRSLYQDQKITKPKPEDVAEVFLDAERAAAMLNLVTFVRDVKVNVRWVSCNSWALNYKGKQLGFLKIYEHYMPVPAFLGTWFFCHRSDYLDRYYSMEDCELKTFVFEHIYAKACGRKNCFAAPHADPGALQAGYANPARCGCWPLRVYNPDGEKLERTKQLIEYRMKCLSEQAR